MKKAMMAGMLGLAFMAAPLAAWAVPAAPGLRAFTQPDGSVVMLELCGDEYGAFLQDANGRIVMQQPDGLYVYAKAGVEGAELASTGIAAGTPLSASEAAAIGSREQVLKPFVASVTKRRAAVSGRFETTVANAVNDDMVGENFIMEGETMTFGKRTIPLVGEPRIPVVLAQFADRSFDNESTLEYYERWCNDSENPIEGFGGSVKDYFVQSSYGKFKPHFEPIGPVTVSRNYAYYGRDSGNNIDINMMAFVREVATLANNALVAEGRSLADYDNNNDGAVDGLIIIFAGVGQSTSTDTNTIWPVTSYLYQGASGQHFMVGDVEVDAFSMTCEKITDTSKNTFLSGPGVFVHEMSHLLGLPDLYTTTYVTGVDTPGPWSVMDSGSYAGDVYSGTPPLFSAFETYMMGWTDPVEVLEPIGAVELPAHNGVSYAMPMDGRRTEFYMFETRSPKGWDAGLPGVGGLLAWHIDYSMRQWMSNTVNNTPGHPCVQLIRASESTEKLYPFGGRSRVYTFTDQTTPALVSWAGRPAPSNLYDIKFNVDKDVTTFRFSATAGIDDVDLSADNDNAPVEWFTLQGVKVDTPTAGIYMRRQGQKVEKVAVR